MTSDWMIRGWAARASWTPGWLRPRELIVILLGVDTMALLTAQVVMNSVVVRLDTRVYTSLGARSPTGVDAVTELGSAQVSGALLTVTAIVTAATVRRWWPLLLAAGNALAAAVIVLGLKFAVGRTGPGLTVNQDGYSGYLPSGHTAAAAVCLGTAVYIAWTGWRWRPGPAGGPGSPEVEARQRHDVAGRSTLVGLVLGTAVGSATVVTGNHWVSDVVAGLAVSVVVLVVGLALARRHVSLS